MPTRYLVKGPNSTTNGAVPPSNVIHIKGMAKLTGNDTYDIVWNPDGTDRVVPNTIPVRVGIDANSVDGHVFIADDAYQVVKVSEVHSTVGGSAAVAMIRKCTGTTAPASGTALSATNFDLTATINTNQNLTLVATTATLQLAVNDKLAIDVGGTLTGLVGTVTIWLRKLKA